MRVVLAVEGNNFVADPDPEGELDDVRVGVRTRKSEVPGRLFVRHVRKQLNLAENSNKFLAGKFKPSFGGKFKLKLGGKLKMCLAPIPRYGGLNFTHQGLCLSGSLKG